MRDPRGPSPSPLAGDVDEPIVIVAYDPRWPELFARERARIRDAAGPAIAAIEHFGSTSVPGLAGKPIVDLLVGVERFDTAHEAIPPLEALGYESFGEIFIRGRLYLRRRAEHHFDIALTAAGGEFWNTQLTLREYLRAHADEAASYAQAKRAAHARGARRFSTCSARNAALVDVLTARARTWQAGRAPGDQPA